MKWSRKPLQVLAWRFQVGEKVPRWLKSQAVLRTDPHNVWVDVMFAGAVYQVFPGMWIVKGPDGSLTTCSDAVFRECYEAEGLT